jgi:hypothetical protein
MPLVCRAPGRQKKAFPHPIILLGFLKNHLKFNELAQFVTVGIKLAHYIE